MITLFSCIILLTFLSEHVTIKLQSMTVFKNRMQKRQPPLYQVDLYPLSVLSAALLVSRACLNCDFIIARLIVIVNIKSL